MAVLFAVLAVGCGTAESDRSAGSSEQSLGFRLAHEIHHLFGNVVSVAVDPGGRVFLADAMTRRIWEFDANGALADSIGREGDGPGEFGGWLRNIQWLADTLYTFDFSQRLTAFSVSGDSTRWHRTVTFYGQPVRYASVNPENRSVVYTSAPPELSGSRATPEQTTVHAAPPTAREVEAHTGEVLKLPADEWLVTVNARGGMVEEMPFGRSSFVRLGPDGSIYHLWTGEPHIRRYDINGSLLDEISLPGALVRPVTPRDVDDLVASIARLDDLSERARDGSIRRIESARAEERLPSHWPVATDFMVDERGRLWIALVAPTDVIRPTHVGGRVYSYASPAGGGRHVVVIDPENGTSRSGMLDAEGQVVAVSDNKMYVLTTDSLGVQFVKVFAISGDN